MPVLPGSMIRRRRPTSTTVARPASVHLTRLQLTVRVRSSTDGRRRNGNETAGPSPTCGVTTLTRTGHKTNPNPTDRSDPRWFPTRIRRKSSGSSPAETPSHGHTYFMTVFLSPSPLHGFSLSLSLFRRAVCESDSDARGEIKNNNNSMSKKKKNSSVRMLCSLPSWEESRQKRSGARDTRKLQASRGRRFPWPPACP